MSTPTATPRTDDEETPLITNHRVSAETYKRMVDFARTLETELAAAKAECERLMNQRDNLLKPLRARAEDRADAADEKVERLTSENEKLTIERDALANGSAIEIAQLRAELERADVLYQRSCEVEHALRAEVKRWQAEAEEMSAQRSHNANQAGRLRAELAVAENWVEHHSKHADDLIAENVKLRADLERFTGHGLLDCHAICDQRDAAMSVAQKATDELACEKENRNHLIEKGAKLETELAAMKAEFEKIILLAAQAADRNVELRRLAEKAEAELVAAKAECNRLYESSPTALDALTAELARLRAELVVEKNWVEHHSKHADDLIAENVKLRADLERFTGHGLLDCHMICDQRDAANARAARAEAALAKWSVLNLWGGTPEIIHEFIKGQQNRIHHCQDLEAECLEQARLLGMSGEREADLLGKLERLAKDKARLDWLLDRSAQTHHSYSNPLGGGNYVQYHKDRAAIDAAMKP